MPGNLDFRVYAAATTTEAVTVLHEWVDEPSFAGYLASSAFARSGAVLRPLMTRLRSVAGSAPRSCETV